MPWWMMRRKVRFAVPFEGGVLHVTARKDVSADARAAAGEFLDEVRAYAVRDPGFVDAKRPIKILSDASPMVRQMARLSAMVGVGPVLTLRGALVEYVGLAITRNLDEVAVWSKGNYFVVTDRRERVPLSSRRGLALIVRPELGAHGISITTGLSPLHRTDTLAVVADSCVLAGAGATAVAASLTRSESVRGALSSLKGLPGIYGALVVQPGRIDMVGSLEVAA
jgi:ApbE superfamily uncharacterized protein (UPF0280 family)